MKSSQHTRELVIGHHPDTHRQCAIRLLKGNNGSVVIRGIWHIHVARPMQDITQGCPAGLKVRIGIYDDTQSLQIATFELGGKECPGGFQLPLCL